MRCVYCQNYGIASSVELGKSVDENRLSEIFLELQGLGANNINLVTATHYVPHVVEAVALARREARLKYRRRQFLYQLRDLEKKGKALMEAGITREVLDSMYENCDETE